MTDIKLFQLRNGQVTELDGQSVAVEKSLQTQIESHLESFLGVTFLATEYVTGKTHGGRIDTLLANDPRMQLMLGEAARTGWPEAYTDDLYVHDIGRLTQHPGAPMLWILRQNGTHLYPLQCDNRHEAAYYRQVIRYWSGDHKLNVASHQSERARYFVVTSTGMEPISSEEAETRITVRAP